MARYIIVNDNQVGCVSLKDADLTKLALKYPDTGLITLPVAVSVKDITNFIDNHQDMVRNIVKEYKPEGLITSFFTLNNIGESFQPVLISIKNKQITRHQLPVISPKNGDVVTQLVNILGNSLVALSDECEHLELFVQGQQSYTNIITQLIQQGTFPKNNISLFVATAKHLPLYILNNMGDTLPTFDFVTNGTYNSKLPTVSQNEGEYLAFIKKLNQELRRLIMDEFTNYQENLTTANQEENSVEDAQVEEAESSVDDAQVEEVESSVTTLQVEPRVEHEVSVITRVADKPVESVDSETLETMEAIETSIETTVEPVEQASEHQIETVKSSGNSTDLVALTVELNEKNALISTLECDKQMLTVKINELTTSLLQSEETRSLMAEELATVQLDLKNALEAQELERDTLQTVVLDITEENKALTSKVQDLLAEIENINISNSTNNSEIERLTNELLASKQNEEAYKSFEIKYNTIKTEYEVLSDNYHDTNGQYLQEVDKNKKLEVEVAELKDQVLKLKAQIEMDSNLEAILDKLKIFEHTLNHIETHTSIMVDRGNPVTLELDSLGELHKELDSTLSVDEDIEKYAQLVGNVMVELNEEKEICEPANIDNPKDTLEEKSDTPHISSAHIEPTNQSQDFFIESEDLPKVEFNIPDALPEEYLGIESNYTLNVEDESSTSSQEEQDDLPITQDSIYLPPLEPESEVYDITDEEYTVEGTPTLPPVLPPLEPFDNFGEDTNEDLPDIPDIPTIPENEEYSFLNSNEPDELYELNESKEPDELTEMEESEEPDELTEIDELEELGDLDDLPPLNMEDLDEESVNKSFSSKTQVDDALDKFFNGETSSIGEILKQSFKM